MKLERKIYTSLLEWKNEYQGKRSLLIEGARRTGKSWIAEEFGRNEYKSYILINFAQASKEVFDLFEDYAYDINYIYSSLSVIYNVELFKRESLIILDEVQLCPKARQLTKQLVADGRYDIIETGSLLSIKENVKDIVIPSEEKKVKMFPLDFEEFLWAKGNRTLFPLLRKALAEQKPLGQAVQIAENSFQAADREKRDILELYRDDVAKHAGANARKVRAIFDRIPSSLTHKEKKFNLSSLGKNTKLRTYEDAFFWLDDAMITNMCYNAEEPVAGLNLNLDDSKVKCYMMDTGLLVTHALNTNAVTEDLYKAVLMDRLGINEGMIAENYTAQALATNGHKLFFYSKARAGETRSNELEIDFLIMNGRKIVPIEVKSSQSVHHSSLTKFMSLYSKHIGMPIVLCRRDLEVKDGIIYMPIYMASLL